MEGCQGVYLRCQHTLFLSSSHPPRLSPLTICISIAPVPVLPFSSQECMFLCCFLGRLRLLRFCHMSLRHFEIAFVRGDGLELEEKQQTRVNKAWLSRRRPPPFFLVSPSFSLVCAGRPAVNKWRNLRRSIAPSHPPHIKKRTFFCNGADAGLPEQV